MQDNEHKEKRKPGLHKEISSIFEGVPVPGMTVRPATPQQPEQSRDRKEAVSGKPAPAERLVPKAAVVKTAGKSRLQKTWRNIKNKLFKTEAGASSSRQKVMVILAPILFIALIYVLMPLFKKPKISEADRGEVARVDYKGEIDWQVPEPYPTTLRDPMQSPSVTAAAGAIEDGGSLIVKGIIYSRDHPAAVIGTQMVHEGDVVAGARIVKINQDSVEFGMNDKKWTKKVQR